MTDFAVCTGTSLKAWDGGYFSPARVGKRSGRATPRLPVPQVGTGGLASLAFIRQPCGYAYFPIVDTTLPEPKAPSAQDMARVKAGFGRTMSYLPGIFGVSRQTLYNWLKGDVPKEQYQESLHQLARAASVFIDLGFKPTPAILGRAIESGKAFNQMIASGEDGHDTADKLVRIVRRGSTSRAKLDALLAEKKTELDASHFGATFPGEQA